MSLKMEVGKAIFSLRSKKPHFSVSAFHHRLIFGLVSSERQTYEELKCFEIEYSDYHQLYIGLFPILKCLSSKSDVYEGTFLNKENCSYKWKVCRQETKLEIIFFILTKSDATENATKFSISFSLNEFNDLLYLITELCFLSLNLSFETLTVFQNLSNLDLSKLLTFQNKNNLKAHLQLMKNDINLSDLKLHCACEQVFYNLDVIICIHKLRLFYNDEHFLTRLNIQAMQQCEAL